MLKLILVNKKSKYLLSFLFATLVAIFFVAYSPENILATTEINNTLEYNILDFHSKIQLTNEDLIYVTERIEVQFNVEKHGIYRDIPFKYSSSDDNVTVDIDVISVKDQNGNDWTYTVSKEGDYQRIRIGDADIYVSGNQTYYIEYSVKRAIGYFEEHDEIYWNVTGNGWPVPIEKASATIIGPESDTQYFEEIQERCLTGYYGSEEAECRIETIGNISTVGYVTQSVTTNRLEAYSGLTIVVGYPKGLIEEPSFTEKYGLLILLNSGICLPLFVLPLLYLFWKKYGKDAKGKGTIMPNFKPPEGLTPGEAGTIIDNTADNKDITATVIDLAIRGFIKIEELEKKTFVSQDYKFTLLTRNFSDLKKHETIILNGIFSTGKENSTKNLSELKQVFYLTMTKVKNHLHKSVLEKGYYTKDPTKLKKTLTTIATTTIVLTIFFGTSLLFLPGAVSLGIGIITSAIMMMIFGLWMPQRTYYGTKTQEDLLGLKLYINTAEKDRIETMQSPDSKDIKDKHDNTIELFEKLLPYAMIFGIEKQWAKQYEGIYKEPPSWYAGNNWHTFNTMRLANSLGGATKSMNSTFTSSPKSSGSGFSSGGSSGGGGFSGGGFGGGGGGSW